MRLEMNLIHMLDNKIMNGVEEVLLLQKKNYICLKTENF